VVGDGTRERFSRGGSCCPARGCGRHGRDQLGWLGHLLLGALALAGAAYAVAAAELSIIGSYLVLVSQGIVSVYKEVPSSDSTTPRS